MSSLDHDRTILVVSDLHCTSGIDRVSGRWSPTEDFFWDGEFRDFLAYYREQGPCTLVVNGDWFDFLQVLVLPTEGERELFGIPETDISRRYGLRCSEPVAEFQVEKVIIGHPLLFQAIADFLAVGNELKILKGNHDIQLHWPRVQERIYRHLADMTPQKSLRRSQIEFLPWCYLVPGLLYVEHGNQYEESCAFRNFLIPRLPGVRVKSGTHIELDLSSFLVRYLTNAVETMDPLADNVRPLSEFYVTLLKKYPLLAVRIFGTALRYVLKALKKSSELRTGRVRHEWRRIATENDDAIRAEARRFAGGDLRLAETLAGQLRRIYHRGKTPMLEQGPRRFLWSVARRPLAWMLWLLPLYALTFVPRLSRIAVRMADESGISALSGIVRTADNLNLLSVVMAFFVALACLLVLRLFARRHRRPSIAPAFPEVSLEMRKQAEFIAQELDVRFVTFGHTHYPDTAPLRHGGRYFNTGTWMGILEAREQLYREMRQFTFLQVTADSTVLLRWNPERQKPQPVIVMEMLA